MPGASIAGSTWPPRSALRWSRPRRAPCALRASPAPRDSRCPCGPPTGASTPPICTCLPCKSARETRWGSGSGSAPWARAAVARPPRRTFTSASGRRAASTPTGTRLTSSPRPAPRPCASGLACRPPWVRRYGLPPPRSRSGFAFPRDRAAGRRRAGGFGRRPGGGSVFQPGGGSVFQPAAGRPFPGSIPRRFPCRRDGRFRGGSHIPAARLRGAPPRPPRRCRRWHPTRRRGQRPGLPRPGARIPRRGPPAVPIPDGRWRARACCWRRRVSVVPAVATPTTSAGEGPWDRFSVRCSAGVDLQGPRTSRW